MNPFEYMIIPLKRYADFQGRSRRMEYWMFYLFTVVALIVAPFLAGGLVALVSDPLAAGNLAFWILGIIVLGFVIPSLACLVRRLHDQDKSGWWALIGLIPILGALVLLVFMFLEGTKGNNQYGPDPKADIA